MKNLMHSLKNENGQVMLFASLLIATVSLVGVVGLYQYSASVTNNQSFLSQQRAFYIAEGVRKIALAQLGAYLQVSSSYTGPELTQKLQADLPTLVPQGYLLQTVSVNVLSYVANSILPSGPFAGMQSPATTISLTITVRSTLTNVTSTVTSTMSLGAIYPFQFMIFGDMPYADWEPRPAMTLLGRVHVNGDACLGAWSSLKIGLITASGRIMDGADTRCRYPSGYTGTSKIATNSSFTAFTSLLANGDNGCTNCAGTGQAWPVYARNTWGVNAVDQALGGQALRLPGAGTQNRAQFGVDGNSFAPISNQTNTRFSIDPPLATDTPTISPQKYANNADIRVIDGVWYLKDPANQASWPGLPIWSDHPGRADAVFGPPVVAVSKTVAVGQDDIRAYWATRGVSYTWTAAGPSRFSFYEYVTANASISADPNGILSYGNLGVSGVANPPLVPSGWMSLVVGTAGGNINLGNGQWNGAGQTDLCFGKKITCAPASGLINAINPPLPCNAGTQAVTCQSGSDPGIPTFILNAARGGFRDQHLQLDSPSPNQLPRSKIYPINFDVGQFQTALKTATVGELGSYFGVGKLMGRNFNGIIYVTATWPGSLTGFGSGQPQEYPYQGAAYDSLQMPAISPSTQTALPYALCSNLPSHVRPGLAGVDFDRVPGNGGGGSYSNGNHYGWGNGNPAGHGTKSRFEIPDCASYSSAGIVAFPNALRVYNGANFDAVAIPSGLSLVTNLPMYLVGNYNTNSVTTTATSTPWLPAMLGSDSFYLLSNNWTDANDDWTNPPAYTSRNASTTSLIAAILTGYMRKANALQYNGITAFLEDWSGTTMNLTGSVMIGFYPVYHLGAPVIGTVYNAPVRNYVFDPHFSYLANQPPGTLVYPVSAVSTWQGD